ncbi:hypothetical protein ACHQM5_009058 [Ranunculus cassubicifolius]
MDALESLLVPHVLTWLRLVGHLEYQNRPCVQYGHLHWRFSPTSNSSQRPHPPISLEKEMAIVRATPTFSLPIQKIHTPRPTFLANLPQYMQVSNTHLPLTLQATPNDSVFTLPKDEIITSLTKVETTIEQIQGVLDFSQHKVKFVINLALPILQKTGDQALKIASPVIEEVSKKTQEVIQGTGINPEPVYKLAKIAGELAREGLEVLIGAKPIVVAALEIISRAEPVVIVEASGGLLVTYLFLPPIWSALTFNLRGYKGKLTPAQTLDVVSRRNYFMIDIRLHNEKNIAGVPLLPSSAKNKMISLHAEKLPRYLRSLVRDTKEAEAGIIALKISYLKMIHTHSNIVIMDSYCDMAKTVARELTKHGFKNCWVMAGGFSGNQGWLQNYLGRESYNISSVEVLSLPRAISPEVRKSQSDKVSS